MVALPRPGMSDLGRISVNPISHSQSGQSQPRSGNSSASRKSGPYEDQDKSKARKAFNDEVWNSAQDRFVLKIWSGGAFFFPYAQDSTTGTYATVLDMYARESYNSALSKYFELHPDQVDLLENGGRMKWIQKNVTTTLLKVSGSSN
jgi:hypothetical protein